LDAACGEQKLAEFADELSVKLRSLRDRQAELERKRGSGRRR